VCVCVCMCVSVGVWLCVVCVYSERVFWLAHLFPSTLNFVGLPQKFIPLKQIMSARKSRVGSPTNKFDLGLKCDLQAAMYCRVDISRATLYRELL
jgi:hypothetical protein